MDFKCFMNLLEEKKYIKKIKKFEIESETESGYIAIDYRCKYEEVRLKIQEEIECWHACDLLHNIQYDRIANDKIKIIFVDKLKHHIWNKMGDEEYRRFEEDEVGYINLQGAFNFEDEYEIEYSKLWGKWEITDLTKKNNRIKKEIDEKQECINFLNQLPR